MAIVIPVTKHLARPVVMGMPAPLVIAACGEAVSRAARCRVLETIAIVVIAAVETATKAPCQTARVVTTVMPARKAMHVTTVRAHLGVRRVVHPGPVTRDIAVAGIVRNRAQPLVCHVTTAACVRKADSVTILVNATPAQQ